MAARTLLFGGTFDPVHVGHLRIALALAEAVGVTRVLLVPTGVNPLKPPPVASCEDRLTMLKLATKNDARFEICERELHRPPPSYTIDTVEARRANVGPAEEIHLAMGADMLGDLPKWHRAVALLRQVRLAVACRPPMTVEAVEDALRELAEAMKPLGLETLHARAIPTPLLEISSTDLRRRIAAGQGIAGLLPEAVEAYVREKQLYGNYPKSSSGNS